MLDSVMNKSTLVMDFNASIHTVGIESFFRLYLCINENLDNIMMENDEKMKVQGVGTICLKFHVGKIKKSLNMRYVIDAPKNV